MSELELFIPITKVDAAQRLVYGIATAEIEDRSGEICDYASTKPFYEQWSDEIAKSTGGKSLGNLRAMHNAVAAGKITALDFNDARKQIEVCAKIIDDGEWLKVREGVYTGFSQGGSYIRRWTDEDGKQRYTAQPLEISLVDLPCLPQARFELVKADGSREWRQFEKGFGIIARLSAIIAQIEGLKRDVACDPMVEALDPDLADQLKDLFEESVEIMQALVDREASNHAGNPAGASRNGAPPVRPMQSFANPRLLKLGARNNADDLSRIQAMHDTSVELGAACPAHKHASGGHAGAAMGKGFETMAAKLDELIDRVKNIESQPMPLPFAGQRRVVSKGEDFSPPLDANDDPLQTDRDDLALLAIKKAQRSGRSYFDR